MQLALLAGIVVGAAAPLIGVFLVQKGLSLMGDGIGHVAVAGIGASLLLGTSPTWTALVVAVVAALVIEFLRTRGSATGDLALALVFYGGIAAGVVLASRSATNTNLQPYLFGSILTATADDVWTVIALGAVIVVAIGFTGRALLAVVLDEDSARVAGIPARALNAMLAVLTAVTVVMAMRIVGVLLIAALDGAPGRHQPAAGPLVPGTLIGAVGVGRRRRRSSGCSRRASGRSPPAARSCSSPPRCSRWRRSSPAPAAPAPRPTPSSPDPTSITVAMAFIVTRIQVGDYDMWKPMFDLDGPGPRARRPDHRVLRNVDDPNEVYIFIEFASTRRRGSRHATGSSPRACSTASPTTTDPMVAEVGRGRRADRADRSRR